MSPAGSDSPDGFMGFKVEYRFTGQDSLPVEPPSTVTGASPSPSSGQGLTGATSSSPLAGFGESKKREATPTNNPNIEAVYQEVY